MNTNNSHQCYFRAFYVFFFLILATLIVALILYCCTFNGGISQNSADWSAFATFIGSIGTMLFTALNVWAFFNLTSIIAHNEEKYKIQDRQFECVNKFRQGLYRIFSLSSAIEFQCEVPDDNTLVKSKEWLMGFKKHKDILPILGEKEYDDLIEKYIEFCKKYQDYINCGDNHPEQAFDGHNPEEEFYHIFLMAQDIVSKMLDEIIFINV